MIRACPHFFVDGPEYSGQSIADDAVFVIWEGRRTYTDNGTMLALLAAMGSILVGQRGIPYDPNLQ